MSYVNFLLAAERHTSKTAKALSRSLLCNAATDNDIDADFFQHDESEMFELRETQTRYANATHDFS